MSHTWPIPETILTDARNAAVRYVRYANAAVQLDELEELCAAIITIAYQQGERDSVNLSNYAVDAVEKLLAERPGSHSDLE